MKNQIQIRIYPDGKIEAATHGIKGKKCTDYIQILEQILESRTKESKYTDEYYQEQAQVMNQEVNNSLNK